MLMLQQQVVHDNGRAKSLEEKWKLSHGTGL